MHQHKLTDHNKENTALLQSINYDILGLYNNSNWPIAASISFRHSDQTGPQHK